MRDPQSGELNNFPTVNRFHSRSQAANMTINHIFVRVTASRFAAVRSFYLQALKPLGYRELITIDPDSYVGIGSNYPYLFLRALPKGQPNVPTHIAFDAHSELV
jgi:hypothetical protein